MTSTYTVQSCARPDDYITPAPFSDKEGLETYYETLDHNRQLREACTETQGNYYSEGIARDDLQTQLYDATEAMMDSSYYLNADSDVGRDIRHVTGDILAGVDPSHAMSIGTGVSFFGISSVSATADAARYFYPYVMHPGHEGLSHVVYKGSFTLGPELVRHLKLTRNPVYYNLLREFKYGLMQKIDAVAKRTVYSAIAVYLAFAIVDLIQHRNVMDVPLYEVARDRHKRECANKTFGQNMVDDMKCFGQTRFDTDAYGRALPDARGRRKGDFRYLEP